MKLNFDKNNKKVDIDVDAERLVEKGMDLHEKDWKDKFNTKHNAKKEIMELKHKQNIENKEQDLKKKSFVKELFEGINDRKQMELEEKRRIAEEKLRLEEERIRREQEELQKSKKERKLLGVTLLVVGFLMMIVGLGFGKPDSGLQLLGFLGVYVCIAGILFLVIKGKKRKQK